MDSKESIRDAIVTAIIDPLILLLFAAGVFMFMWGLVVFMTNLESQEKRREGTQHMLWGIIGIFIMASVLGILRIVASTIGVDLPG